MSNLEVAEKIVSMWSTEGYHTGQTETEYYFETLEEMGISYGDAVDIVNEIDLEVSI